ncbi:MAG: hypothetical protein C4523_13485 [Myxococcales bacterium]|nr:MAG: hypothetical protein C4523_13485 [Myxococcales bacterium]
MFCFSVLALAAFGCEEASLKFTADGDAPSDNDSDADLQQDADLEQTDEEATVDGDADEPLPTDGDLDPAEPDPEAEPDFVDADIGEAEEDSPPENCSEMSGVCVGTAECPPGTRTTWLPFGCVEPEPYCCAPDGLVACEELGGYCEAPVASACYRPGYELFFDDPLGCDSLGGFCCLPEAACYNYIAALADCPYQLVVGDHPIECPVTSFFCMDSPCRSNGDCLATDIAIAGEICVLGDCVACWQDSQCPQGRICRAGRCVSPEPPCPPAPPCTDAGCRLLRISEVSCPVCICDYTYAIPCATDEECLMIEHHPYSRCVWGRCADCKDNDDCGWGDCLPPGMCFDMQPHPEVLYGAWLIGWWGALNHYSYFRFEPDGTLRRGTYPSDELWQDDIPQNWPCYPEGVWESPAAIGTWQPEMTESGFLAIRMTLNIDCDPGAGWTSRFLVTPSEDGNHLTLRDIDFPDREYEAIKVPADRCTPDFRSCAPPWCEGVWHEGAPAIYPPFYTEDPAHVAAADWALDQMLRTIISANAGFAVEWKRITYTLMDLQGTRNTIRVLEGSNLSADERLAWAENFLASWPALVAPEQPFARPPDVNCSSDFCIFSFHQDYCGRSVVDFAPQTPPQMDMYRGVFSVRIDKDGYLDWLKSDFVPYLALPRDPVVPREELVQTLMNHVYQVSCADGPHTYMPNSPDNIQLHEPPEVFVYRPHSELERVFARLAYRATVTPADAFATWTAYVDAVDGSFIAEAPDFICD